MKKIFLILLALGLFACKQTTPITEQPMSPEIEAKLYELLMMINKEALSFAIKFVFLSYQK